MNPPNSFMEEFGIQAECPATACQCGNTGMRLASEDLGVSQYQGYRVGGHNANHHILGSLFGPLALGNYHLGLIGFLSWMSRRLVVWR